MGVLSVGTGRGVAEVLFVASVSPRTSRVAYLVAALVSSRACWRVVRAGRSLGPRWRTHHMRTPRATQMARSSISEQPGRSEPDVLACQVLTRHSRRESQASKVDGGGAQVSGRGERRLPSTGGVASCHEKAVDLTAGRRARCRCVLVARRGGGAARHCVQRGPQGQSVLVPTEHPLRRSSSHIARRAAVERSRVMVVCIAYQNKRQPSADSTH